MNRRIFEEYITEQYGAKAEYPWEKYPQFSVFRHKDNRKWFAVVMRIPKRKLGIDTDEAVDVVNLKCASELLDSMWKEQGIYPAYHMHKGHWITALLDGSVDAETLFWLLEISVELTAGKKKK